MSVLLVVVVQPFFQIGLQRNLRRERTQNNYAMSELDSSNTFAARCANDC